MRTTRTYGWLLAGFLLTVVGITDNTHSRPLALYISGGISDPSGELAKGMEVGYHGLVRLGVQLEPRTEFLIGGEYHTFNIDDNRFPNLNASFRSIMVGFDVKIDLGLPKEPIAPFLLVGGGYANIDFSDTLTQISSTSTFKADANSKSYFEFGGGFAIKQAFALLKYVNIFTEQADGRYFSVGIGYKLPLAP